MPANLTIELKELRFFAHHGWYEEEVLLGHEFDVTLLATFPAKETITSIEDTIDYSKIYELLKAVFSEREKLLETVAQKIIHQLKEKFPEIQRLQLTITKLSPLIPHFTGTVGITYSEDFK